MEAAFVQAFQATLQPDADKIRAAEQHLQEHLHTQPEAGLALVHIVFTDPSTSGLSLPLRQAAAVNLSKWIKERWSVFFAEFLGFPQLSVPATSQQEDVSSAALPPQYKEPIRDALLNSFSLPETKLRGPMIKALIHVAACDWPDEFPQVLPAVKTLLQAPLSHVQDAQAAYACEGALSFLDEWFYSSMDEESLMSITRDIMPVLESLLRNKSLSPEIRCHTISILNQTLETLFMVKEQYPEAAKTVAQQVLLTWLSILEEIVAQDCAGSIRDTLDTQTGQALALHEQAWKTFVTATHFGSHIKPRLQILLSRALSTLHALQAAFERIHVYPSADIDFPDDGTFFATPSTLAARIVDFVGVLLQKASFRSTLDSTSLSTFVLLLRSYSRITATEEEEWLDNVAEFVAAGDDDELGALSSSLRSRCADVLGETMSVKPAELLTALSVACSVAHQQGQDKRAQAQTGWWKEEEASLSFVGGQAENVMEKLDEETQATKSFDIESLFSMSVMPYMDPSTPAFLYGRCFVFASQFSPILPTHLANAFLDAAVMAMEDSSNVGREGDDIVKLSAVRCVKNFHRHLDESVVQPYAARILGRLAPLLDNDNEDLIVLITETLQAVAAQRDAQQSHIPAHIYGEIAVACIKAWAKQSNMRAVQMVVDDLLEQFASQKNEDTVLSTLQGSVPCLAQLLGQEANGPRSDTGTLVEGVLGFASALTRGANADTLNQAHIIDALLPPLFTILHATVDREIYQSAAELLGDLLDKMPESFCAWSDAQGINAPQHTLNLVSRMIAPNDSYESGGLAPGNLLTALLRKQPQSISSSLPDICRTLVARLATSLTPSLTQSMVVPLAYLMKDHIETVVELLLTHTVASADGTAVNAMEILLRKWVEFAPSVQGFWHERVSALGLCAVWNAGTTNSNLLTLINTVLVDGDMIPDKSDVIKTRSRAKTMPDQFTQVPLSAKIIKVLLGEYKEATDGPPHNSGAGANSTDDDDGDQEWDDDEDDFDADLDSKRFLSDLLGEDVDDELSQLVHKHDQDKFGSDAIWNMPYRSYLTTFFQRWAQDIQVASAVTAHLNAKEVGLLQSAVA